MTNRHSDNSIIIYESPSGAPGIQLRLQDETVWLTQAQLSRAATVKEYLTVQQEGSRVVSRQIEHYSLDLIISLGYRIKSRIATRFRIWATLRFREYIVKGFTVDDERLKNAGGGGYWKELLERIRDIRSSEKVLKRFGCEI